MSRPNTRNARQESEIRKIIHKEKQECPSPGRYWTTSRVKVQEQVQWHFARSGSKRTNWHRVRIRKWFTAQLTRRSGSFDKLVLGRGYCIQLVCWATRELTWWLGCCLHHFASTKTRHDRFEWSAQIEILLLGNIDHAKGGGQCAHSQTNERIDRIGKRER